MQAEEEHHARASQERRQRHREQRGERRERHQERRPSTTDDRPREHRDPASPRSSRRRDDYPTEQPTEQRSSSSADRLQEIRDEEPVGSQEQELVAEATEPFDEDRAMEDSNIEAEPMADEPVVLAEMVLSASTQERQQSKKDFREQHAALNAEEDARIVELKAAILDLERQKLEIIKGIRGEGTPSEIIDRHIKQLHRYNEIKDAGQIILGKCAELEGTTIKKQYEAFGLDLED
ncbi:Swi5-domain-containing protein [Dissophora ornata]|nr:Swi5-domain-containing protein [Dissophora ornata]